MHDLTTLDEKALASKEKTASPSWAMQRGGGMTWAAITGKASTTDALFDPTTGVVRSCKGNLTPQGSSARNVCRRGFRLLLMRREVVAADTPTPTVSGSEASVVFTEIFRLVDRLVSVLVRPVAGLVEAFSWGDWYSEAWKRLSFGSEKGDRLCSLPWACEAGLVR